MIIGVDLAGLLGGGRMASAEGGSVSSGMAYGEGCSGPLSSRLRGLGELPQYGDLTLVNCWMPIGRVSK